MQDKKKKKRAPSAAPSQAHKEPLKPAPKIDDALAAIDQALKPATNQGVTEFDVTFNYRLDPYEYAYVYGIAGTVIGRTIGQAVRRDNSQESDDRCPKCGLSASECSCFAFFKRNGYWDC